MKSEIILKEKLEELKIQERRSVFDTDGLITREHIKMLEWVLK